MNDKWAHVAANVFHWLLIVVLAVIGFAVIYYLAMWWMGP